MSTGISRKGFIKLATAGVAGLAYPHLGCGVKRARQPNIIYILADDLGYGDLSCYGQRRFQTPHIDALAGEGLRFTNHYAGSTVCAPSRSCLLTGMHTGHTPVRGNREVQPEGQYPLPEATVTVAETLRDGGYVTGIFGKWGLGYPGSEGTPGRQGFDQFFGYNGQRRAHHYYPFELWENETRVPIPENEGVGRGVYAPDLIHTQTLAFIEQNKDRPFFLYVPSVIPHAELFAPEAYMAKYRGQYLPEKSYAGYDEGPHLKLGRYGSQPEAHAAFAAMINVLDDQVGEIVAKVQALGLDDNTIIMFSSDNGPHREGGADPDYFDSNGPLRGYKRDLYEGGIRVPLLARWPGRIAPNTRSEHISAFWDMLPTFCELAGRSAPSGIDGISFVPTLLGSGARQREAGHLYWEFHEQGGKQAVRLGRWKGVRLNVRENHDGPIELYDLANDEGETTDVAADHPEIVATIRRLMTTSHDESEDFPLHQG